MAKRGSKRGKSQSGPLYDKRKNAVQPIFRALFNAIAPGEKIGEATATLAQILNVSVATIGNCRSGRTSFREKNFQKLKEWKESFVNGDEGDEITREAISELDLSPLRQEYWASNSLSEDSQQGGKARCRTEAAPQSHLHLSLPIPFSLEVPPEFGFSASTNSDGSVSITVSKR